MHRSAALTFLATLALCGVARADGDPILPLSQVTPGMRCTGYSVIRGTDVSSFDVEIEDVVSGDPAARQPRLLVKVSGPAVDATGIGPGFSGSPIYCTGDDGVARNAGAISESLGDYGNKVALATPIEAVLGEPVAPPADTRYRPALVRAARPIAEPLSLTGFSPSVAGFVRREAARRGRVVYDAPAVPLGGFTAPPLRPGSAMAIGLASGDVTAGAIGTVTYVDGDRIWAFGHPEDSVGRRDLLLESAYVYTVVNNPLGTEDATTYKLAAPGSPIGALTQDGVNAVGGVVGSLPPRYPLHIVAQNLDTGGRQTTNVLLADETAVGLPTGASALAQVGPLAVAQAAYTILGGAPQRVSGSMCARFSLRELPRPLRFCNTYVGGGGGDGSLAGGPLAADFAQAASAIDSFAGPRLHVTGVTVDMKLAPGLREAFLLDASAPRAIRRGHDLRVRLALERAGGGARLTRVIRIHIPRATPTGPAQLRLRGTPADQGVTPDSSSALDLSSLLGSASTGGPAPRTLTDLALAVAEVERYDGVIAAFQARGTAAGDTLVLPAYRDPSLRISGSARLRVLIRR